MDRPIFVVGSGRSGTVFMGQVLKRHPSVHCTIEREPVFLYASRLGLNPYLWQENPTAVRERLRQLYSDAWTRSLTSCRGCSSICRRSAELSSLPWSSCHRGKHIRRVADKSHQLVLSVPAVLAAFPDAQFVHLVRDGRDVLASMLRHKGIVSWFSEEYINEKSPWPQPWFGVRNAEQFKEWQHWSLAKKCALRWVSWVETGLRQSSRLGPRVWLDLRYEDLVRRPTESGRRVFSWLGLDMNESALNDASSGSVGGWRRKLSEEDLREVIPILNPTLERLEAFSQA
jgi:hypothetical protein